MIKNSRLEDVPEDDETSPSGLTINQSWHSRIIENLRKSLKLPSGDHDRRQGIYQISVDETKPPAEMPLMHVNSFLALRRDSVVRRKERHQDTSNMLRVNPSEPNPTVLLPTETAWWCVCLCPCLVLGHLRTLQSWEIDTWKLPSLPYFSEYTLTEEDSDKKLSPPLHLSLSLGQSGLTTCAGTCFLCMIGWPLAPCLSLFLLYRHNILRTLYPDNLAQGKEGWMGGREVAEEIKNKCRCCCISSNVLWPVLLLQHWQTIETHTRNGTLRFSWEEDAKVRRDNRIPAPQPTHRTVLIIGPKGCGKSTLFAKLLGVTDFRVQGEGKKMLKRHITEDQIHDNDDNEDDDDDDDNDNDNGNLGGDRGAGTGTATDTTEFSHGTRVGIKVLQVTSLRAVTMELWDVSEKEWETIIEMKEEEKRKQAKREMRREMSRIKQQEKQERQEKQQRQASGFEMGEYDTKDINRNNDNINDNDNNNNGDDDNEEEEESAEELMSQSHTYLLEAASRCDVLLLVFDGSDQTKQSFYTMQTMYESLSSIVAFSPTLPPSVSLRLICVALKCGISNRAVSTLSEARAWACNQPRPFTFIESSSHDYIGIKELKGEIADG